MQSMEITRSELDLRGSTSYVELLLNHRSDRTVKNTKYDYCAFWCILARLHFPKTKISLPSSYVQYFNTINKNSINFDYESQIKNNTKLEK